MERSVFSSRYIFLEALHKSGGIDDTDYILSVKLFEAMAEYLKEEIKPDLIGTIKMKSTVHLILILKMLSMQTNIT